MSLWHYAGALAVFAVITGAGIYSGRRVSTVRDFTSGNRRLGTGMVMGTVIGTLVGGSSTIGTAQLAYTYGFSAWWFTLGGGLGCLTLLVFFLNPLYKKDAETLPHLFSREYGEKAGVASTLLMSMGSFLSIIAQIISGIVLIQSVSNLNMLSSCIILLLLMLVYVIFGGVWGTGLVGIAKVLLMYVGVLCCGLLSLRLVGGAEHFYSSLPHDSYFSLFARGPLVDIGSGISLILGVLSTQTYIQAVMSAKNLKTARRGALLSALLIPIIGIAGIFVGMYMKLNYPNIAPASALPIFVMEKMPPLIAGAIMAVLLVALVGTGAGMSLGLSSMLIKDIYNKYINNTASDKKLLWTTRALIVLILTVAGLFASGQMSSIILEWSFLSMALRGAVAFVPLCGALFLSGRIGKGSVIVSMLLGPAFVIAGKLILPPSADPLLLGVCASAIIMGTNFIFNWHKKISARHINKEHT